MNYKNLKKYSKEVEPALLLDGIFSYTTRSRIRRFTSIILILGTPFLFLKISGIQNKIDSIQLILFFFLCVYVLLHLLEAMYRSYYFKESNVDFRVLQILNNFSSTTFNKKSKRKDITEAFLTYEMGMYTMYRLGFSKSEIQDFIKNKTDFVTTQEFEIIENDDNHVSFSEFGYSLTHFDSDLAHILRTKSVTLKDFKDALDWVGRIDYKMREQNRWWIKDRLFKLPSIGKNLSFGQVYQLEQYGHLILQDPAYIQLGQKWRMYASIVEKIESVLAKSIGGNAIIVAKENYIGMEAIASLGHQIFRGKVMPDVENKRLYVLDTNLLVTSHNEKSDFEYKFREIIVQAANAGNVVLIIPNFAEFIKKTYSAGFEIMDTLHEALRSSVLQILLTCDERAYHETIETDFDLMSFVQKIQLQEFDETQARRIVEDEVLYAENRFGVFFTYQSIKSIVESADRYFSESSLSSKSIDILYEIIPIILKDKKIRITQDDIDKLISSKTGMSLGKISSEESHRLSQINTQMHARVIGQNKAVDALCDAMIRSRAGLANPKRPLGSFIFVGPTGVGKTETAKALAEVFFGDEERMLRSDMSEYADTDALNRMIGDAHQVGIFASKVREAGHGVLLLDEFEKASEEVHDLFLQIVDEGYFTDGRGEKVMMRNFIIIATSNVGSELLYSSDSAVSITKEEIISYIVSQHLLKIELLNRFDDIIVFDFLGNEQLLKISQLLVQKLIVRLDQRGITLKESPELIKYIVHAGSNPKFGAREMNRIIIKEIESKIAQALVLGDLFEGDTISFTVLHNELQIQKYS